MEKKNQNRKRKWEIVISTEAWVNNRWMVNESSSILVRRKIYLRRLQHFASIFTSTEGFTRLQNVPNDEIKARQSEVVYAQRVWHERAIQSVFGEAIKTRRKNGKIHFTQKLLSNTSNLCLCCAVSLVHLPYLCFLLSSSPPPLTFRVYRTWQRSQERTYSRYWRSQSVYGNNLTIAIRVRNQNDRMKKKMQKKTDDCRWIGGRKGKKKNMRCDGVDDANDIGKKETLN